MEKIKYFKELDMLQPFRTIKDIIIIDKNNNLNTSKNLTFIKIPPYCKSEDELPSNTYCIDNKNYYCFFGTSKVYPISIICEEVIND